MDEVFALRQRSTATKIAYWAMPLATSLIMAGTCSLAMGCSGADDIGIEGAGTLVLPLTTTHAGVTYRLVGSFAIHRSSAPKASPLLVLWANAQSNDPTLTARLPPGDYLISLCDGWTLQRVDEAGDQVVEASLMSDNPRSVTIRAQGLAEVRFRFRLPAPPRQHPGTLVIGIDVEQEAICGNGQLESGETCDDGAANGLPHHCDTSCAFECDGACPLRVNPAAAAAGTGASWDHPLRDLRPALAQQSSLGGGDIWIVGGDQPSLVPADQTIVIPSHVHVLGGFAGTERTAAERAPGAPHTVIHGGLVDPNDWQTSELRIVNATDVELERVDLLDRTLFVQDSTGVRIRELDYAAPLRQHYTEFRLDRSQVRLERLQDLGGDYLQFLITASDVAMVESIFGRSAPRAEESRVFLGQSTVGQGIALGSLALIQDCSFTGGMERGPMLRATDAIVVDSQFAGETVGGALLAERALVWNSRFVGLWSHSAGGSYARTEAIEAPSLEVGLCTFAGNACTEGPASCKFDVATQSDSLVHNSLFVNPLPELAPGQPLAPAVAYSVVGTERLVGNYYVYDQPPPDGDGRGEGSNSYPLAAVDAGDAVELEAGRLRLLERAAPFAGEPFRANLSRYSTASWWQNESVLLSLCNDPAAPDPGRHYIAQCGP